MFIGGGGMVHEERGRDWTEPTSLEALFGRRGRCVWSQSSAPRSPSSPFHLTTRQWWATKLCRQSSCLNVEWGGQWEWDTMINNKNNDKKSRTTRTLPRTTTRPKSGEFIWLFRELRIKFWFAICRIVLHLSCIEAIVRISQTSTQRAKTLQNMVNHYQND